MRKVLLLSVLILSPIYAAEITIAGVTASSTFFSYSLSSLTDGTGLTGDLHDGDYHSKWMTNGTPTGTLLFDLGAVYSVGSTKIWNYGPGCCGEERSTRDLTVSASIDGITYTPVGSFVLGQPQTVPFPGEIFELAVNARYIQFDLLSTYGESAYIGLSEVKFFEPVPEPGTLGLLGSALGLLLFARRKGR
ncbi:MAG: discoidin domain-containing protein [Acidobacteria bacterium]|nr:discoidin domain-containing protein [Acidobacteriota bacterium]